MNGSHILVAGIAYKRDIDDMRESPALDVMGLLHQQGARLQYADPLVPRLAGRSWLGGYDLESLPLDPATIARADCVAILTDHTAFDYDALVVSGLARRGYPQCHQAGVIRTYSHWAPPSRRTQRRLSRLTPRARPPRRWLTCR